MPYALCLLPYAFCLLPYVLCPTSYALSLSIIDTVIPSLTKKLILNKFTEDMQNNDMALLHSCRDIARYDNG